MFPCFFLFGFLVRNIACLSLPPKNHAVEIEWRDLDPEENFEALLYHAYWRYQPIGELPKNIQKRQLNGHTDPLADLNIPGLSAVAALGGLSDTIFGEVRVGLHPGDKPRQPFVCLYDTGSASTLIPGSNCKNCLGTERYRAEGRDLKQTTRIPFGSGKDFDIVGQDYLDTVQISDISAEQTIITAMTSIPSGIFSGGVTGLLGLSFSSLAAHNQSSFIENLLQVHRLAKPQFAFFIGRDVNGTKSSFELGSENKDLYYGKLSTIPVIESSWWKIAMRDIKIGGVRINAQAQGDAILDTGTPGILMPKRIAKLVYNRLNIDAKPQPGTVDAATTTYTYKCDAKFKLEFMFEGKPFAVNPLDLSAVRLAGGRCQGSIIGADIDEKKNTYVLGAPFLKNWYTIFNYGTEGGFGGKPTVLFGAAKGNQ